MIRRLAIAAAVTTAALASAGAAPAHAATPCPRRDSHVWCGLQRIVADLRWWELGVWVGERA